jgi:hypothetical protein
MSAEIDTLPLAENNDETARLADLIEGVAGRAVTKLREGSSPVPGPASRVPREA